MSEAEQYYRSKYPRIGKLTHMDNEIISILEGYEIALKKGQKLPLKVSNKSETLKGNYRQCFLDWKSKYFTYVPKTYDYKTKSSKEIYTLNDLHKSYEKAMLKSPFKQPNPTSVNNN